MAFVAESQSNDLEGQFPHNYEWPDNLEIWGWDGAVHSDTYVAIALFRPDASTPTRPSYVAMAEIAKEHPDIDFCLASFAKGAQFLSQWRVNYPSVNAPPGTKPGCPILGGGFTDVYGRVFWNMRKVRDNNVPPFLAAAGVSEISGYLMMQGENEAFWGLSSLAFIQANHAHHLALRGYSWFPYTTPFVRSSISPYRAELKPYNLPLQIWALRDSCRQFVDLSVLPEDCWGASKVHLAGRGTEYAGRLWAKAWSGRKANVNKGARSFVPVAVTNVNTVGNAKSFYDVDPTVYKDEGFLYVVPSVAGTVVVSIPIVPLMPMEPGTFTGSGLALNTQTGNVASVQMYALDDNHVALSFTAIGSNPYRISWGGRAELGA